MTLEAIKLLHDFGRSNQVEHYLKRRPLINSQTLTWSQLPDKTMGLMLLNFPGKKTLHHCHQITKRRTRSLVKRLSDTPDLMRIYNQIIKEQESRGFVEKVAEKPPLNNYQIHYLPCHYVKKNNPIPIVYDCSCRMSNDYPSLNNCLDVGCPLINDLCSIVIRFRTYKYGLSTDIEEAFLHVQLHNDACDYIWFLCLFQRIQNLNLTHIVLR